MSGDYSLDLCACKHIEDTFCSSGDAAAPYYLPFRAPLVLSLSLFGACQLSFIGSTILILLLCGF
jgi:hypothetical protein